MLLSWLVTMASRPKGRHLSRVTLKMAKAESSTSPIAWGRWGGYKTDGIREYYRYDRPTHGRGAPGTSDPSPGGGAPDPRPRDPGASRRNVRRHRRNVQPGRQRTAQHQRRRLDRRPITARARTGSDAHARADSSGAGPERQRGATLCQSHRAPGPWRAAGLHSGNQGVLVPAAHRRTGSAGAPPGDRAARG